MGTFIEIRLDPSPFSLEQARLLASVCPVDIFAVEGGRPVVRPDEVDECTLCELCLDLAAPGAIVIQKLYKDQQLVSRGPGSGEP
jgi:NAD-dependent dihydropyrimidine dehydrogenase PreA subunit